MYTLYLNLPMIVWVDSGSWWWTGRSGVLQFMGLQRVGHDWATELNNTSHVPSHFTHTYFSSAKPSEMWHFTPSTSESFYEEGHLLYVTAILLSHSCDTIPKLDNSSFLKDLLQRGIWSHIIEPFLLWHIKIFWPI